MEMTTEVLQQCCKEHGLYRTASLNDKLYLNFKGFHTIENLEPYTALRALFLEGNAIDSLKGLPPLKELRCLFVQCNMIWEIDGLEGVDNLDTLNISENNINRLQNLSHLPALKTLICSNNRIGTVAAISHAADCKALSVLDLSNNRIEGTMEELMAVLKAMPQLTCLYLKGNPIVSQVKNYRKTLVSSLSGLTYLDDRPVFELERVCAEGWAAGGLEGEREARRKFKEAEAEADRRNFESMQKIRQEGFRKRREKLGLPPGDEDPYLDEFSDDEWQEPEEPPELVAMRRKLAEYSARPGEEEPVELTKTRQELVKQGVKIKEGYASRNAPQASVQVAGDAQEGCVPRLAGDVHPLQGMNAGAAALPASDSRKARNGESRGAAGRSADESGEAGAIPLPANQAETKTEGLQVDPAELFGGHKVEFVVCDDGSEGEGAEAGKKPQAGTFSGSLDDLD